MDAPKGSVEAGGTRKLVFSLSLPELSAVAASGDVPRTFALATAAITLRSETFTSRFRVSLCGVLVV